ncbi:unnamed protein product [Urochloa decumbens]|uniref:Protein kinase domain-containing protein n=1 Tax=Urochloa decumbens TaxID=240449 RepID=A0ABC8W3Y3_9POAL
MIEAYGRTGFISIDCGVWPAGYGELRSRGHQVVVRPDAAFTVDAGSSQNISVEYVMPTLPKRYLNVRSFPDGERNCYTLRSLVAGLKYLLRAEFLYGNYDGLSRPPIFDLYAGVNFWSRVNVSTPDEPRYPAPGYIAVMHFSELRRLSRNAVREFFIEVNGDVWVSSIGFRPDYLLSIEVYSVISTTNVATDSSDGSMSTNNTVRPQNETPMSYAPAPLPPGDVYGQSSLHLENRRFTYKELDMITNNFQHVLGRGGFGKVYNGFLEDGTQVAVKLRSQSSNQGVKEFLSEVRGNGRNAKRLTWRQRLRIALDSAQGLEYLHKGCNPTLIHRDVKATNILLNAKLEAKIADFGLSKVFNHDDEAHISMNTLVGTPGYVDPAYQANVQPTTKSDVYSFGVVLLELVTGRQAILSDPEPTNIIQWVRRRLARGNIEDVVDPRMRGEYDVNSVWKVADIALKCTTQAPVQRPTMTDVVAQLQECLELEEGHRAGGGRSGSFYTGSSNDLDLGYNAYAADIQSTDLSQASTAFEMEHKFGKVPEMGGGPVAR